MAVPYSFGSATAAIPLSQLDSNFATTITLGNTAIQLGNTVTTLNNMTLANVTVQSGNVTIGQANAVVYTNGSNVATANASAIAFNGTNLAVGCSISGTAGSWKSIELGDSGSGLVGGYGETDFVNNLKADRVGAFSWVNTGYAGRFNLSAGVYSWTAGTGSAGNQFVANGHTTSLNTNGVFVLSGGNTSATGVGIAFPATQSASSDANTLDDYEEGSWTPSITQGATGISYTQRLGTYTKIGRFVYCKFTVSGTWTTSGATCWIGGIPFTVSGDGGSWTAPGFFGGDAISGTPIPGMVITPVSNTYLYGVLTSTGAQITITTTGTAKSVEGSFVFVT